MEFPETVLVSLIKRAMQGDERHQYTYSQMATMKPDRSLELAKEAKRQLDDEGVAIIWCPDLTQVPKRG
ncbi:unnamed protein product [marine sediment metagenome]|uniref:Uncharacterized protein n=1 Tax=marine sediment metagenome TaxID=412755 RepID=X1QX56_9ZZZZ